MATTDPQRLVPGSPSAVAGLARRYQAEAQQCAEVGEQWARLDLAGWSGEAADAFGTARHRHTTRLHAAGDALQTAAAALDRHAEVLGWAQRQASEAVALAGTPLQPPDPPTPPRVKTSPGPVSRRGRPS